MDGMDARQRARFAAAVRRTDATGVTPEALYDMLQGSDSHSAPASRTRQDLVAEHDAWRARVSAAGQDSTFANNALAGFSPRPRVERSQPPLISKCTPINADALVPDKTHKLRYLRGTLIVQPFWMGAAQTVLEDPNGRVVRVRPPLIILTC